MNTITRWSVPSIALVAFFAVLPLSASAATSAVTTKTVQLLPVGVQSCAPMQVSSVTPYVHNGALDSFDIVTPDASYVSIGGSVGNTLLPFRHMTRSIAPNGQLKIHTDNDPTAVGQGLAVSVTLLSAANGMTCATTVSFTVLPDASYPTTPQVTPVGGGNAGGSNTHGSNGGVSAPTGSTSTTSAGTSTVAGGQDGGFCEGGGALWLWLTLIVIYAVIVGIAAITRTPFVQKSPAVPVAMILVPLIVLVAFWYFSPTCRLASWVPIILLLIGIAGLLAAFRDDTDGPLALLDGPRRPVPMPPAKPVAPPAPTIVTPAPQKQAEKPVSAPVRTPQKSSGAAANPHVQKILESFMKTQREREQGLK